MKIIKQTLLPLKRSKIFIEMKRTVLLLVISLLSVCSCKENSKKSLAGNEEISNCTLPKSIKEYIDNHTDEFEYIVDSDLDLIRDFIEDSTCPTIAYGDFNDNGVEDIAVILRYKKYKEKGYQGVSFPFLVIFNDYAEKVEPYVVYKTGDYADEDIKTVIYDQFDKGIFSYLKKGKYNGKDVVDIVLPEKSIFLVKWNHQDGRYEYLNYMDIDSTNDEKI